ncbi:hypothetical protein TNIN_182771 [Trichonephila inaurata madagascariensis]|uniref:Uncharacterized protein n=1 Tax=Trichonephila inaurata madagascariensis TaxID=2747483 RepID=A0A8X6YCJ0_9ARAC|nr:hypothetical protein TNIN_297851 [Trichonephila inaurata madagascariensis]GFY70419.1 hypothetical protein TNIN_182771 [Trichonephila inaurata madagascariensis]
MEDLEESVIDFHNRENEFFCTPKGRKRERETSDTSKSKKIKTSSPSRRKCTRNNKKRNTNRISKCTERKQQNSTRNNSEVHKRNTAEMKNQQESATDIRNEMRKFICTLHQKKRQREINVGSKSKTRKKSKSQKGSSSDDKKCDSSSIKTVSKSGKNDQNISTKTVGSDPKLKLMREIMYS